MRKSDKRSSSGWGVDGFKGDTQERVVKDARTACFDCQAAQKQADYVFS